MTVKQVFSCLFLIAIAATARPAFGQDLEKLLLMEQSDSPSEKHEALIELCHFYERQKEYLKAFDYWNKCAAFERETAGTVSRNVAFGEAESLYHAGQFSLAIERFDKLLQKFAGKEDSVRQYQIWIHCIDAMDKNEQYDLALNKYSLLIERFSMSKNPVAFASQLNHMGILEKKRKNLTNAFDYFTNARIVIRDNAGKIPDGLKREVFLNLAVSHAEKKEYITSLTYFQTAESLQPMSAIEKASLYNLKGATYLLMGRYEDAQKTALGAVVLMPKVNGTLEEQQTLADSYDLLARLYQDRDWPTYQRYYTTYLEQKEKISSLVQSEEERKLLRSIEIEKNESELRSKIAANLRVANEARQRDIEKESMNRELALKVSTLEIHEQQENLKRVELQKELLLKSQAQQKLLLDKQMLEADNQQKELNQQALVQERATQELKLIRSQKELIDGKLADAKQRSDFVQYIAVLAGVIILLSLVVVVTLLRSRQNLIQGNALISRQKQEIEDQNEEISKTVVRVEAAQKTIESQNKQLTTYNETLAHQVAERTQQLVEANSELTQNNEQLEQYSYMTAHNLRGPIARLLGLTAIFGKLDRDSHAEVVDKIQKEAGSLDTLIKDLNKILQVRKATEELSQTIDLGQSVRQAIRILDTEIEESESLVMTDFSIVAALEFVPTYFENIIYNLVSNAIKYRHPDRPLKLTITSFNETKYVGLHVVDNGLGIDLEKNKQNLFGLYKRFHFHKDGKGLGLYLIKAQLETMGGTIHVQSTVDVGTCFTLFFPREKASKTKTLTAIAV